MQNLYSSNFCKTEFIFVSIQWSFKRKVSIFGVFRTCVFCRICRPIHIFQSVESINVYTYTPEKMCLFSKKKRQNFENLA